VVEGPFSGDVGILVRSRLPPGRESVGELSPRRSGSCGRVGSSTRPTPCFANIESESDEVIAVIKTRIAAEERARRASRRSVAGSSSGLAATLPNSSER
jgi:hypothetical protein